MKQEVKELWIEALLSGEYKQSQQHLQNEDGFCCLGVLCDVYAKSQSLEWGEHREYDDGFCSYNPFSFLGCDEFLPEVVMEWAGLEHEDPIITHDGPTTLSALNDYGHGFEKISELIKEQL